MTIDCYRPRLDPSQASPRRVRPSREYRCCLGHNLCNAPLLTYTYQSSQSMSSDKKLSGRETVDLLSRQQARRRDGRNLGFANADPSLHSSQQLRTTATMVTRNIIICQRNSKPTSLTFCSVIVQIVHTSGQLNIYSSVILHIIRYEHAFIMT